MKVEIWRPVTSHQETVEHGETCSETAVHNWPCVMPARWAVAWTDNPSGLPGLGEDRVAFPCDGHLVRVLTRVSHVLAVTVHRIEPTTETIL